MMNANRKNAYLNTRMPYVNNVKAILLTAAINLGIVFLFFWPDGVTYQGVILDSLICGLTTTVINLWVVRVSLRKMRAAGQMPPQVPISRLMQRLPRNPIVLGALYAALFAAVTAGFNAGILWFFDMGHMGFWPWIAYKLIYTTLLSAKIVEFCIFRYVQPDCSSAEGKNEENQGGAAPVKNPLPKVSVFKAMYGSVTANIAMNIIIGSLLGGVTVMPDRSMVIYPTMTQGIHITGLVFGLIVGILVINGVVKSINTAILASGSGIPEAVASDKRFAWMPKRKISLMCLVCPCMMIFSAVILWAIMTLFSIPAMNFYQFTVFITAYAAIVSKPLSYMLVRRCTQPDYIRYTIKKQSREP